MTREEITKALDEKGIYIVVEPCYATKEFPYRWKVMQKQGYWGGSATYYAPVKTGDASTHESAGEEATKYALNNLI